MNDRRDGRQDEDEAAFEAALDGVKPLPPHNLATIRQPPKPISINPLQPDLVAGENTDGCVAKSGIQHSVLRKIRNGQMPVEDELDLHGLTVQQAQVQLRAFLLSGRRDRQRVVRIIHGKGLGSPNQKSVLRAKVTEWLNQSEDVLAFCPAGVADGGSGAVRVLLKRR